MPNQEKRAVISIISTSLVYLMYGFFVLYRFRSGELDPVNDFRFWGTVILVLIPIQIVSNIVITIVYSIVDTIVTKEDMENSVTDERDKMIDLKSNNVSYMLVGIGFLLSMVLLVIGLSPFVMFNTIYLSFNIAEIVGSSIKLRFYNRGF